MLNETKERISHLNFRKIMKSKKFQTFILSNAKKFHLTELYYHWSMSDD